MPYNSLLSASPYLLYDNMLAVLAKVCLTYFEDKQFRLFLKFRTR